MHPYRRLKTIGQTYLDIRLFSTYSINFYDPIIDFDQSSNVSQQNIYTTIIFGIGTYGCGYTRGYNDRIRNLEKVPSVYIFNSYSNK